VGQCRVLAVSGMLGACAACSIRMLMQQLAEASAPDKPFVERDRCSYGGAPFFTALVNALLCGIILYKVIDCQSTVFPNTPPISLDQCFCRYLNVLPKETPG
jgi:hypothetical protein